MGQSEAHLNILLSAVFVAWQKSEMEKAKTKKANADKGNEKKTMKDKVLEKEFKLVGCPPDTPLASHVAQYPADNVSVGCSSVKVSLPVSHICSQSECPLLAYFSQAAAH